MTPADIAAFNPPADHLAGRIILVTGATKGIGRALALGLSAHGATVILSGRSQKKLEKVYDEVVTAGGPTPAMLPLDLENALASHYDAAAEAIGSEFGRLDGLVHNASLLLTRSPISHYDVPTWCRLLQVNLTATFALTQVCLPLLEKSTDASVVMTSSSVGRRGRAYWGAYAVSKAGVENLAEVLAHEYEGNDAIRFNTLNPGAVRTDMRALAYPAEDATQLKTPAEILGAYLWLLGPSSRGQTGGRYNCQV
jgi:NAD(P)-dependent dehydrogenase (short-subunit alcohol dehydrogenase family)